MNASPTTDIVLETLRKRYFATAAQENYPHTPAITKELDELEAAIRAHVVAGAV